VAQHDMILYLSILILIHFVLLSLLRTTPSIEKDNGKEVDQVSSENEVAVMGVIDWLKWAGEGVLHWSFFTFNSYLFVSFLNDTQN
jgi:hypothetical protein